METINIKKVRRALGVCATMLSIVVSMSILLGAVNIRVTLTEGVVIDKKLSSYAAAKPDEKFVVVVAWRGRERTINVSADDFDKVHIGDYIDIKEKRY